MKRVDHKHQTFVVLYLLKRSKSDRYGDLRMGGQRFRYEIQIDGEVGFIFVLAFESVLIETLIETMMKIFVSKIFGNLRQFVNQLEND